MLYMRVTLMTSRISKNWLLCAYSLIFSPVETYCVRTLSPFCVGCARTVSRNRAVSSNHFPGRLQSRALNFRQRTLYDETIRGNSSFTNGEWWNIWPLRLAGAPLRKISITFTLYLLSVVYRLEASTYQNISINYIPIYIIDKQSINCLVRVHIFVESHCNRWLFNFKTWHVCCLII